MKIKFDFDDNLPLNKMLKLHMLTLIVRSVFEEDGKYYPQVFLNEYSEGIDIKKTHASKVCDICHYQYFLDKNFKYESYLCNEF